MEKLVQDKAIFEFHDSESAWKSIDDVVMGGLSSSRMRVEQGRAVFDGELSLDNNGGFASVRSEPLAQRLTGNSGLTLHVLGDGRAYQVRIRTNDAFDGPSYQVSMTPPDGVWTVVKLPFSSFRPTFRGRSLSGYPRLTSEEVRTIGVLIADKEEGPFRLELDWIRAY
ncbi:MAG: CIA30 family protein [Thermoanaerobaculia bacterium]|nr:CIA30 family protein [Thermoanaerobaculia bacterium]